MIYRPSATLFLLLKQARLTEIDLEDCLALLEFATRTGALVDVGRVTGALDALPPTEDQMLLARRARLRTTLLRGCPACRPVPREPCERQIAKQR